MKARYLWLPVLAYLGILVLRGQLGAPESEVSGFLESGHQPAEAVPPPQGYLLKEVVRAKVTAYEPSAVSCGKSADGKTSTGKNAHEPIGVAICPSAIPYGALLYIPGIGLRVADDTGGAMRSSWRKRRQVHIDVRMRTVPEAREWGVREDVPVHVFVKAP